MPHAHSECCLRRRVTHMTQFSIRGKFSALFPNKNSLTIRRAYELVRVTSVYWGGEAGDEDSQNFHRIRRQMTFFSPDSHLLSVTRSGVV